MMNINSDDNILAALSDNGTDAQTKVAKLEYLRSQVSTTKTVPITDIAALFSLFRVLLRDNVSGGSNTIIFATLNLLNDIVINVDIDKNLKQWFTGSLSDVLLVCAATTKQAIKKASYQLIMHLMNIIPEIVLQKLMKRIDQPAEQSSNKELLELLGALCNKTKFDCSKYIETIVSSLYSKIEGPNNVICSNILQMLKDQYPKEFQLATQNVDPALVEVFQRPQNTDHSNDAVKFGVISNEVYEMCLSPDWRVRTKAIEDFQELLAAKKTLSSFSRTDLQEFAMFLKQMTEDSNFRIILVSLGIINEVIEKISGVDGLSFLDIVSPSLMARLGDTRTIIRQYTMRIFNNCMRIYTLKPIIALALSFLTSDLPRVREEAINLSISCILQNPDLTSEDYVSVAKAMLNCLQDTKTRVKYVASEALAVLLDKEPKVAKLISPTDLAHIQVRMNSKDLPYLSIDGLVEHIQPRGRSASSLSSANGRVTSPLGVELAGTLPAGFKMPKSQSEYNNRNSTKSPVLPAIGGKVSIINQVAIEESPSKSIPIQELTIETSKMIQPVKATLSVATQRRLAEKLAKMQSQIDYNQTTAEALTIHREKSSRESLNEKYHMPTTNGDRAKTSMEIRRSSEELSPKTASEETQERKHAQPRKSTLKRSPTKSKRTPEAPRQLTTEDEISDALSQIGKSEWEAKVSGLERLSTVFKVKSPTFNSPQMQAICVAVICELANLRTQVSRAAISTLTELYRSSGKNLTVGGKELESSILALFKKSGESGAKDRFMNEEIDRALEVMRQNQGLIAPVRVINAFITASDHKNAMVRAKVARNIGELVMAPEFSTSNGASRVYNSNQAELMKLIKVTLKLLEEGLSETRTAAKVLFMHLASNHPSWLLGCEKMLTHKETQTLKRVSGSARTGALPSFSAQIHQRS